MGAPSGETSFPLTEISRSEVKTVSATSTSEQVDPTNQRPMFRVGHLMDGHLWTTWAPGEDGAVIRFDFLGVRYPVRIAVANGHWRNPNIWREFGRASKVLVRYASGEREFELANTQQELFLDFEIPIETDHLELVIIGRYPGERATAPPVISQIRLLEPQDVTALRPEMREQIEGAVAGLSDPKEAAAAVLTLQRIGAPALPWLVQASRSENPQTRAMVAKALGKAGTREVANVLLRLLDDPDGKVQKAAMDSIGLLRITEAIPALITIAEGHGSELSLPAIEALGQMDDNRTLEPLLKAALCDEDEPLAQMAMAFLPKHGIRAILALDPQMRSRDVGVRARAIEVAGSIDIPAARRILTNAMDRGSQDERIGAIRGFGHNGTKEALEAILTSRNDQSPRIRRAIAETLGKFTSDNNDRAVQTLEGMIDDDDDGVWMAAMTSLSGLDPAGTQVLVALLDDDRFSPPKRLQARNLLSQMNSPGAVQSLLWCLVHKDPEIRQWSLESLMNKPDGGLWLLARNLNHSDSRIQQAINRHIFSLGDEVAPHLLRLADEGNAQQQSVAVEMLCRLENPDCSRLIEHLLSSVDNQVRQAGARAARDWPEPSLEDCVLRALKDEDPQVRQLAVEAAGRGRYRKTVPALVTKANDPSANLGIIAQTLGQIGDSSAVPLLAQLAGREHAAEVRVHAVEALGRMGCPQALPVLMEAMTDQDPAVRRAAELALIR